jgi:hypothetical protein
VDIMYLVQVGVCDSAVSVHYVPRVQVRAQSALVQPARCSERSLLATPPRSQDGCTVHASLFHDAL